MIAALFFADESTLSGCSRINMRTSSRMRLGRGSISITAITNDPRSQIIAAPIEAYERKPALPASEVISQRG